MLEGLQQKRLSSYDGTDLCYYTGGTGPAVVLANGLGGPIGSYRHIVEQLGSDYKVLTWDYRGLYGSGRPSDASAVSMDHQIRDLELLMAEEGIDQAVIAVIEAVKKETGLVLAIFGVICFTTVFLVLAIFWAMISEKIAISTKVDPMMIICM